MKYKSQNILNPAYVTGEGIFAMLERMRRDNEKIVPCSRRKFSYFTPAKTRCFHAIGIAISLHGLNPCFAGHKIATDWIHPQYTIPQE
jgi:hypothetical protein